MGSQGGTISTGAGASGLMNKQSQFFTPEGVDAESAGVEDCAEKGVGEAGGEEDTSGGQVDLGGQEQGSQEVQAPSAQEQEAGAGAV